MINIIKSDQRFHADHGWLKTYWHFSFGDYYDPRNTNWSALRVFNDDLVAGGGGFGMHPHRDMEIITYVTAGALRHEDSVGNAGVVRPGEVQVMSAGKGIRHAERNVSETEPLKLLQIWIEPRSKGNKPRWEQRQFAKSDREGRLLPVVSGGDVPGTLAIDQDATIYVASLRSGESVTHAMASAAASSAAAAGGRRHAYVYVTSGRIILNGRELDAGDQARLVDEPTVQITASADAELILLDLP